MFLFTPPGVACSIQEGSKEGEVERKRKREVGGQDLLMNTNQGSPSSIPLSPVSKVYGVCSDRDLASSAGKQPRAMAYVVYPPSLSLCI